MEDPGGRQPPDQEEARGLQVRADGPQDGVPEAEECRGDLETREGVQEDVQQPPFCPVAPEDGQRPTGQDDHERGDGSGRQPTVEDGIHWGGWCHFCHCIGNFW